MLSIRILSPLLNFGVIAFIGFKSLNTMCFSGLDLNLSLTVLIFSILVEIKSQIKNN